ncbi:MAG: DNA polymerase III subunit delta' [Betaproteobacteria bacterium]|nr:DNA polymerase III subunit delta' [Betaproteobacteria bacterium]
MTAHINRLPHALLLCGAAGRGKRLFADALAARLLCESPRSDGLACGACTACVWLAAGTHPDFRLVTPMAEDEKRQGAGADTDSGSRPASFASGAAAGMQIRIQQIRELDDFTALSSHRAYRVVIVDPADALNPAAANAFLKTLEEPPAQTCFLLISRNPARLLPTLRSRCQVLPFPRPTRAEAVRWLEGQGVGEAESLLAFGGGMPLTAAELAAPEIAAQRQRFVRLMSEVSGTTALRCAEQLAGMLPGSGAQAKGEATPRTAVGLPVLVDWLQKWIIDAALATAGAPVIFHPAHTGRLGELGRRADLAALCRCHDSFAEARVLSRHPLNPRLFLEDLLLRYLSATGQ